MNIETVMHKLKFKTWFVLVLNSN